MSGPLWLSFSDGPDPRIAQLQALIARCEHPTERDATPTRLALREAAHHFAALLSVMETASMLVQSRASRTRALMCAIERYDDGDSGPEDVLEEMRRLRALMGVLP